MSQDDDASAPDVVDFDALHAALGELPPPPTSSSPTAGESQGRSSATYASARPHSIPPTRAPDPSDLNAPAVIVQTDDTVPSGPPQQMTVPMGGAPPFVRGASSGPHPAALAGPHPAAGIRPPSPSHPFHPQAFSADATPQPPENVQLTMQMPGRPRRPRTPTIVVRTRGPTKQQKLLVFMAMLLVFVAGGIAFLVYGKQLGLNIDVHPPAPARAPTVTATVAPPATQPPMAATVVTAAPPATAASAATPAVAAPPAGKKPTRPR
ncbi:MAG: hypothetical protein KF764_12085 [Labilithrix sp.]|nr:hypothetical protein [Labilithrix sp.]